MDLWDVIASVFSIVHVDYNALTDLLFAVPVLPGPSHFVDFQTLKSHMAF